MPLHRFADAPLADHVAHAGQGPIRAARSAGPRAGSSINFIDQVIVPPGRTIGLHRHAGTDEEIYVIVSGRGTARLDGADRVVTAGDVLVNPPGGTHGLVNDGPEPILMVVIDVSTDRSAYVDPVNVAD